MLGSPNLAGKALTGRANQMVKNLPAMPETWVQSLGGEDALEEEMATYCGFLALENPVDRGAWWATVHGVTKSQTQLSMYTLEIAEGFPSNSDGKASACNAGDPSSIPGSGRSPGEGNGNPFQYPCLENPTSGQRRLPGYRPWGHKESDATDHACMYSVHSNYKQ